MVDTDQLRAQAEMTRNRKQAIFFRDLKSAKEATGTLRDKNLIDLHGGALQKITGILKKYKFVPKNHNTHLTQFSDDFLSGSMESLHAMIERLEDNGDIKSFKSGVTNWVHRSAREMSGDINK